MQARSLGEGEWSCFDNMILIAVPRQSVETGSVASASDTTCAASSACMKRGYFFNERD